MAASLTTVQKKVTEILNASAAASFSATVASTNYDRVAQDITEACREGAFLIARAILSNPNHAHRNLFVPASAVELTSGEELPDSAAETDLIEIQKYAGEDYRVGVPRSPQEVDAYRTNANSIYGAKVHNAQYSPLAGYYSVSNGRVYFTGATGRGYFPVINRDSGDTIGTAGVAQVETVTVSAGASSDGNITITVTADGMPNSPITYTHGISTLLDSSASLLASGISDALQDGNVDIASWFTVSSSSADVIFTAKGKRANDTTMNVAINFAGLGPSNVTSSTNTTAGVAPDVTTLIPNEYESAWVALAVGFTPKEGDNMMPIADFYRQWGMQELQSIADMSVVRPLPPTERAMKARGDV